MGLRQIRFTLTAGTLAIGPYNLYANSVSSNNLIASNISLTSLQSGVIYTLDDTINTFVIYNNSCSTSQTYSVPAISPSITPTLTPTRTPTITPTITATPSITPTVTITPTATPSITPSPSYVASNFGSGFQDDCVAHILVNDKITATGFITSYNGVAKDSYVQLNLNGTVNTSFVNYANDGLVLTAAYNPTTSQYVLGGYMYSWNGGSVATGMVSLDPTTGARNESFNTNLGSGFNSNVRSIDIQSGGAIVAVGDFTTVNGIARNKIARININGTVDSTFSYNTNDISAVYRVRVFSDDRIFLCADMTNFNGVAVSNAAWLQPDGTLYTQMGNGFTEWFGSTLDVRETNDGTGRIIVGGAFRKFNGNISRGIVRLNPDGSQDFSFTSPFTSDTSIEGLAVRSDGKVIVVGSFTNKIACLNDDGSIDTLSYSFGTGFDSQYGPNISILPNNDLIITGCFTSYNGASANRIVRITANVISPSVSKSPSITPTQTPSITITPTRTPSITPSITVSPSSTNKYSYTNLNYSNVSSTVVCNGGGTTGNNLFWINNATLLAGATVWSDSGLTTLAPSGYYGSGGYYLLVAANGIVSHTFIICPSPSITPTITPSVTITPSITPSPQVQYKYNFELNGFYNFAYSGGAIMTLNSAGGGSNFSTNTSILRYDQSSLNLEGTILTAAAGTWIQKIEIIGYNGTEVLSTTVFPQGTTSFTFPAPAGVGGFTMSSLGTGAGQFQTVKVYFAVDINFTGCDVLISANYASTSDIYHINSSSDTTTLVFTAVTGSNDIAMTNDKMWITNTNTIIEYNITSLSPFRYSFSRNITCPNIGNNLGLAAKNNTTLIAGGFGLVEVDITTTTAITSSIFNLPSTYKVTGDILYNPNTGNYFVTYDNGSITRIGEFRPDGTLINGNTYNINTPWGNGVIGPIYGLYFRNNLLFGITSNGVQLLIDLQTLAITPYTVTVSASGAAQTGDCNVIDVSVFPSPTPTVTPSPLPCYQWQNQTGAMISATFITCTGTTITTNVGINEVICARSIISGTLISLGIMC